MDVVLYGRYNDRVAFCLSALSLLCMSATALIAGGTVQLLLPY
jgi:hypothetical protein